MAKTKAERQAEYRKRHPERVRELGRKRQAEYRKRHPEKYRESVKKSQQKFRQNNPEKAKQKDHESYIRKRPAQKLYRERNKAKIADYKKRYYADRKAAERECLIDDD